MLELVVHCRSVQLIPTFTATDEMVSFASYYLNILVECHDVVRREKLNLLLKKEKQLS